MQAFSSVNPQQRLGTGDLFSGFGQNDGFAQSQFPQSNFGTNAFESSNPFQGFNSGFRQTAPAAFPTPVTASAAQPSSMQSAPIYLPQGLGKSAGMQQQQWPAFSSSNIGALNLSAGQLPSQLMSIDPNTGTYLKSQMPKENYLPHAEQQTGDLWGPQPTNSRRSSHSSLQSAYLQSGCPTANPLPLLSGTWESDPTLTLPHSPLDLRHIPTDPEIIALAAAAAAQALEPLSRRHTAPLKEDITSALSRLASVLQLDVEGDAVMLSKTAKDVHNPGGFTLNAESRLQHSVQREVKELIEKHERDLRSFRSAALVASDVLELPMLVEDEGQEEGARDHMASEMMDAGGSLVIVGEMHCVDDTPAKPRAGGLWDALADALAEDSARRLLAGGITILALDMCPEPTMHRTNDADGFGEDADEEADAVVQGSRSTPKAGGSPAGTPMAGSAAGSTPRATASASNLHAEAEKGAGGKGKGKAGVKRGHESTTTTTTTTTSTVTKGDGKHQEVGDIHGGKQWKGHDHEAMKGDCHTHARGKVRGRHGKHAGKDDRICAAAAEAAKEQREKRMRQREADKLEAEARRLAAEAKRAARAAKRAEQLHAGPAVEQQADADDEDEEDPHVHTLGTRALTNLSAAQSLAEWFETCARALLMKRHDEYHARDRAPAPQLVPIIMPTAQPAQALPALTHEHLELHQHSHSHLYGAPHHHHHHAVHATHHHHTTPALHGSLPLVTHHPHVPMMHPLRQASHFHGAWHLTR